MTDDVSDGDPVSLSTGLYWRGDAEKFQWADLILSDGGRIHYRRTAAGRSHFDAVFEHTESPTEFNGSQLQWNGGGWNIDLRNGGRYMFGACIRWTGTPSALGWIGESKALVTGDEFL